METQIPAMKSQIEEFRHILVELKSKIDAVESANEQYERIFKRNLEQLERKLDDYCQRCKYVDTEKNNTTTQ